MNKRSPPAISSPASSLPLAIIMDFGYDEFGRRTGPSNGTRNEEQGNEPHNNGEDVGPSASVHSERVANEEGDAGAIDAGSSSDFSDDVELVVGETGNQSIEQPLVEAAAVQSHGLSTKVEGAAAFLIEDRHATAPTLLIGDGKAGAPSPATARSFLELVGSIPARLRSVAVIGCLHHGKTSVVDLLLDGKGYRQRQDELDRGMTLKSHVISTMAGGSSLHPTAHLFTLADTPGHPDFIGETSAALRLADAALFCVDVVESMSAVSERLLRQAIVREQIPVVLVLTKIDRLILDLKLPPLDAYRKMRLVIDAVNNVIASCGTPDVDDDNDRSGKRTFLVSPENGTVCFSSSVLGCFFSLETFAQKYAEVYPSINAAALAQKLWGQVTLEGGAFKKITAFRQRPSFVTMVLEPLYKIVAHAATGAGATSLSAQLSPLPRSPLTAVQEAVRHFCGNPSGEALDGLLAVLPSGERRLRWLRARYGLTRCNAAASHQPRQAGEEEKAGGAAHSTGRAGTKTEEAEETVVVAVAPLLRVFREQELAAVVRVVEGCLRCPMPSTVADGASTSAGAGATTATSQDVVVVDEHCTEADPYYTWQVKALYIRTAEDGYVPVSVAHPGQTVYVTGVGKRLGSHLVLVGGTAASPLLSDDFSEEAEATDWLDDVAVYPFACAAPLVHVSLELKDPKKAEQLNSGLQTLLHSSPGLDVHKEENGEFVMTGGGELHLDTVLHELRCGLCAGVKLGLSQPYVSFSETVLDDEGALAVVGARKTSIGCTSGVLPRALTSAIEYGQISLGTGADSSAATVKLWTTMRRDYGFDALDAQHVMALGPDKTKGPSLLIDDTLEEELPQGSSPLTRSQRQAIIAGFRASLASGPLIGDTVRGVGVKLIFADVDGSTRDAMVLSSARAAVRQSLLGARPRLLEPVLAAEVLCPAECTEKLGEALQQRRGALVGEEPIAATTLIRAKALVPAMDSFGLETQLRMLTHGQAFPFFSFAQWDVVPGDPFDATIHVAPLEPAKGYQLARDFVLKTRFRKGLPLNILADL